MHLETNSQLQELVTVCNKIQVSPTQPPKVSINTTSVSNHSVTELQTEICTVASRIVSPIQQSITLRKTKDASQSSSSTRQDGFQSEDGIGSGSITDNKIISLDTQQAPPKDRGPLTVSHQEIRTQKKSPKIIRDRNYSTTKTVFGTIYLKSITYEEFKPCSQDDDCQIQSESHYESSIVFHPADWLLRLGLQIGLAYVNSTRGWQRTLKSYHAVPDDSLIFEFCASGNIDGIKNLLRRNEASIWDRSSRGLTPLHVSLLLGLCHLFV